MTKRNLSLQLAAAVLATAAGGCGGGADGSVTIAAGDATALAAAVADPGNAGKRIELARGTYAIGAALRLQKGMTLVGTQQYVDHDGDGVWDPLDAAVDPATKDTAYVVAGTETILDGSNRSEGNVVILAEGSGVEGLTIRGKDKATESANTFGDYRFLVIAQGMSPVATPMRVTNTLIERGYHAIGFFAEEPGTLAGVVEHNILRDNTEGVVAGATRTHDAHIEVVLTATRVTGGLFDAPSLGDTGLAFTHAGSLDSTLKLTSTGNIIDKNSGTGVFLTPALNFGPMAVGQAEMPSSQRNRIEWQSTNDTIWRNGYGANPSAGGAITIFGSFDLRPTGADQSGNQVVATLVGTRFAKAGTPFAEQNTQRGGEMAPAMRSDVLAIAGYIPSCGYTATANTIDVSINGAVSDNNDAANPCLNGLCTTAFGFDNIIAGTSTNKVTITPSDPAAFTAANTHLDPPLMLNSLSPACP